MLHRVHFLLALTLIGCADSEQSASEIRGGLAPAWTVHDTWRIASAPEYVIGNQDRPEYTFEMLRGATLLSTGALALLDTRGGGVRLFDDRGIYLGQAGRSGSGPGEFKAPWTMARLAGDTIAVSDMQQRRITLFNSAGEYVRIAATLSIVRGDLDVYGSPDGSQLLLKLDAWEGPTRTGLARDTVLLALLDVADGSTREVARIGDFEIVRDEPGRSRLAPFARGPFVAAGRGVYAIGDSNRPFVRLYRQGGDSTTTIETVRLRAPVEADDLSRSFESRRSTRLTRKDFMRAAPDSMPYFDGLLIDPDTNVWIRRYEPPWSEEPSRWDVYTSAGTWLGTVRMPGPRSRMLFRTDLLEVGRDYVLIVTQDSLDVASVAKHRLQK